MFGKIFTFIIGVYVGIYADQNYKIPKVDDLEELKERVDKILNAYKKDD